jgi:hypothetical protein
MTGGEILLASATAVSAVGQLQAGANAQKAANFNAQVAFNNAHAARQAALENSKRQKRLGAKRQGVLRAIDPDKLDLLEDSAIEEELAVQSIIHGGEVEAVGFENNARLEIARGKSARSQALFGAAGSILMGSSVLAGVGGGGGGLAGGTGLSSSVGRFTNTGKQFFGPGSTLQLTS